MLSFRFPKQCNYQSRRFLRKNYCPFELNIKYEIAPLDICQNLVNWLPFMINPYYKSLLAMSLIWLCYFGLMAQNTEQVDQVIADLLAAVVENAGGGEGSFDFNTLYEKYEYLQKTPIDLNRADRSDLQEIFFLNEIQISNLLEHRKELGALNNLYELQTIPGFDSNTIRLLKGIATTQRPLSLQKISISDQLKNADHTIYLKWKRFLQTQAGFLPNEDGDPPRFLGDQNHLYLRYKMNIGNTFKMGFIAEKDYGEPYFYPGKTYGADYLSFHVFVKDFNQTIRFLALGDYSVNLGQGLIMHNGFGAGKSSLTTSIRKGGYPLRAYSSVAEANFLRGVAATLRLGNKVEWTSFLSSKFRNGTIELDATDPFTGANAQSLPLGGLNRTISELERKNQIRQNTLGNSIKYRFGQGHIAFNGIVDQFNATLVPVGLYQDFFPRGSVLWNASADFGFNWRNINFFGEYAVASNFSTAQIHGLLIGLDAKLDWVLSWRNYSRGYRSLSANTFGESQSGSNEQGIYSGIEFRPKKGWQINAYVDYWRHPWLRFRVDAPSFGKEYFLKVKYFKKRTWELYMQYFLEDKLRNINGFVDAPVQNLRQRFRINGIVSISKDVKLRQRIEFSWYDVSDFNFTGFMVYQDIIYKPVGKSYSFNARYALFDIEDYDSRIYAYENDILNEYYIPAYSGRGLRLYVNGRWRATRNLTVEARYEMTKLTQPFNDENGQLVNTGFGSGVTAIEGRVRSQVKAQIKYKF